MLSFVLAAACSRTSPDTSSPETAVVEPSPAATAPAERNTADDEIFGVLDTINEEAIEHGEFMKKWAKTQKVKEFAAMMINDHEFVRERETKVRDALDLRATTSRLASDIKQDSRQKLDTMGKIDKGDPLDKSYIDIQVDVHAQWLAALDTKLIPFAQTQELREELEEVRKIVESHYNLAVDMRTKLAAPTK
jgi:predicted outer membrane protein